MRIGMITGEYPPMQGGVGAFTHELGTALAKQGHSITILTDHHAGCNDDAGLQVCGQIRSWNRAVLFEVRHWAETNRFDVVNIQYEAAAFQMAALVHWLPRRLGHIPAVTTFHDLRVPYLFPKAGRLRYQALLALAHGSDGVIVTNREDELRLCAERGIAALSRIPIGSNIRPDPPPGYDRLLWRREMGVPDEAIVVGYFGFLNASKGIDTLIEGSAEAITGGLNLHVLMIGGRTGGSDPTNAAYAAEVDRLIEEANLGSRLHRTGFVDDAQVSGYLLACDVLALPFKDGVSFRRGSFLAGIAHGCAIITTTPAVDLPELCDGENVCLVPPDSSGALAQAIRRLADDPVACQKLGANARSLSARFTWDHIAAETIALYRRVAGASTT